MNYGTSLLWFKKHSGSKMSFKQAVLLNLMRWLNVWRIYVLRLCICICICVKGVCRYVLRLCVWLQGVRRSGQGCCVATQLVDLIRIYSIRIYSIQYAEYSVYIRIVRIRYVIYVCKLYIICGILYTVYNKYHVYYTHVQTISCVEYIIHKTCV